MDVSEAIELLTDAVPANGGSAWADLGAGDGTFTLALAGVLGADARVIAVDRDASALRELEGRARKDRHAHIRTVVADFTQSFELTTDTPLDGMLFANSLHYVRQPEVILSRLLKLVRPGGRVVFVEYDRRRANPWVPYPIDADRLPRICAAAGLSAPTRTASRPSDYGGDLYVAWASRS